MLQCAQCLCVLNFACVDSVWPTALCEALCACMCGQRPCNRSDMCYSKQLFFILWVSVNLHSPLSILLASIKTSTTCCSVGSDAQTLSLLFWASLPDHTAEGLMGPVFDWPYVQWTMVWRARIPHAPTKLLGRLSTRFVFCRIV
jgi:hypothetical protein